MFCCPSAVEFAEHHSDRLNFRTFGGALISVWVVSTGEDWAAFMHELADTDISGCVEQPVYSPTMCGFVDAEDCVKLNGCGTKAA